MQRIALPSDVCPDPSARYYRTLAEAFPCNAAEAVAFHRPQRRPHYGRWLALVLMVIILIAMSGCSAQAATEGDGSDRQHAAAQRACPKGYAVDWLSANEMQCLRERQ